MKKVNFLLCSPSPRDISQVYEALKKCPYDRLYAKYFPEVQAYNLMRQFFLGHPQYTHMVICPDDLVVEPKNVKKLKQTLENSKIEYDVLAGVCNVDMGENKDFLCVTRNLPHPTRWVEERGQIGWRTYDWVRKDDPDAKGIKPVKFSGFACQAISRKVLQKMSFQDDSKFNGKPTMMTGAIDVMFANQCFKQKPFILQWVDFDNKMLHLKLQSRYQDIQLGDGELRFYPTGKDMFEMIYKEPLGQEREWLMHKKNEVVEGISRRGEGEKTGN